MGVRPRVLMCVCAFVSECVTFFQHVNTSVRRTIVHASVSLLGLLRVFMRSAHIMYLLCQFQVFHRFTQRFHCVHDILIDLPVPGLGGGVF